MKKLITLLTFGLLTIGVNAQSNIADIPEYYREAAIKGRWSLISPPQDMAMQAWLDQKKAGEFWGVAFRNMFSGNLSKEELKYYIPNYGDKRRIIYQNPANVKDAAYWAQQFADSGSGVFLSLIASVLIFLLARKVFLSKNGKV